MSTKRNLIIDTTSEVYNELRPWCSAEFWDFGSHVPVPNSVYVLGRQQVVENAEKFKELARDPRFVMVFGNSAEGSDTLVSQIQTLELYDLVMAGQVLLIGGGDMESKYPYVQHDHFLCRILDYPENIEVIDRTDGIFSKVDKPYKFLFLNGRARPHRKYIWERFRELNLLDSALWTMLDTRPTISRHFRLDRNSTNLMATSTPLKRLPTEYEVERFRNTVISNVDPTRSFVKHEIFENLWGEIYLQPEPYVDTYFSLVTETVFNYPYSFRTEKIAKPLAIGHPWIVASGMGFYRDMRNLGFRTFDGIIDESFDLIENNQDRMERIITVVQDLCSQNLQSFLSACESVCKYNQQYLHQFASENKASFPDKFFNFIQKYRP